QLYLHLMRRNLKLYGATFAVGDEDAVYLVGQLDNTMVCDDELDRVLGSLYVWVEQFFRPALRIGFASKFQ
ncbi:MAG: YbjN domain-containing protein, partial [Actinomycetia bacterium]|nr:YbjN domain-containing protein [Actinomycetes bacterium]